MQRVDTLTRTFHAYSSAFSQDPAAATLNEGGKILLPQSFLQDVTRASLVYPLQMLIQTRYRRGVYCGVLSFVAPEGQIIMPYWMLQHLQIEEGTIVQLQTCDLRKPTLICLRPHQKLFTELSNPRAVLEATLKKHTCLTNGSTIIVKHAGTEFEIDVTSIKGPRGEEEKGVLVVDSDVKVDFERPLDMPPTPPRSPVQSPFSVASGIVNSGGVGGGMSSNSNILASASVVGGGLTFGSGGGYRPPTAAAAETPQQPPRMPTLEPKFVPFKGPGRNLKGEVVVTDSTPPSLASSSVLATPSTPPPSLSSNPTSGAPAATSSTTNGNGTATSGGRTLGSAGAASSNPVLLALQRRLAAAQQQGGGGGEKDKGVSSTAAQSSSPHLIGIGDNGTTAPAANEGGHSESAVATGFIPFGGKGRSLKS